MSPVMDAGLLVRVGSPRKGCSPSSSLIILIPFGDSKFRRDCTSAFSSRGDIEIFLGVVRRTSCKCEVFAHFFVERGEAPAEYESASAGELCELVRRRRGRCAAEVCANAGVPNPRGVIGVRGRWNTCLGTGERTLADARCLTEDIGGFARWKLSRDRSFVTFRVPSWSRRLECLAGLSRDAVSGEEDLGKVFAFHSPLLKLLSCLRPHSRSEL